MLEKGNYISWESRFRRFLDNKLEEGEQMWRSIKKGPYVKPMILDPGNSTKKITEPLSKMTEINKKQYIADVRVTNYFFQAINNDIYNSVDACKSAQEMWERIKRLMYGFNVTNHEEDYQEELQGDSQEDKLTIAMMLLARAITQKFSTPTNNRYDGNGNRNARRQNKSQAFNVGNGLTQNDESNQEQMLLAMKDEAGSNLKDEEDDSMLDNSYGDETLEELTAVVILMEQIQSAEDNVVTEPSKDA
ncbi:hypothetical protein Tco_0329384 [Tanacetum coccineum]